MNEEMLDLARRAVACRGWRWMPGMLGWRPDNHGVSHSIRFVKGVESMEALAGVGTGPLVASGYATCDGYWRSDDVTPDLTDHATLGCLLALVQEAWHNPSMLWDGYAEVQRDSATLFFVMQFQHDADGFLQEIHRGTGRTMAEALVAALEAAP